MTSKTIMIGLVAIAFVAGSIMATSTADAAGDKNGKPFAALWDAIHDIQIQIDGISAAAGPPGVNGTNGIDGTNGTNGINGVNGTNGVDGTDGNINLWSTYTVEQTQPFTGTTSGGIFVECETDDVAVSGGANAGGGHLVASYPFPTTGTPTGWNVWIDGSITTVGFTGAAYVTCLDLTP